MVHQSLIIGFIVLLSSCGVQYKALQPAMDGDYIYVLPYQKGQSYFLVQGYNSWFSHKGRLGLDFKMKEGTPVLAARAGIVTSVEEGFKGGGISKKYLRRANGVVIKHSDDSYAMYGHLKQNGAAVSLSDTVKAGQLIGYSGGVGYSAFPHLHFTVWKPGSKGRNQIATRFRTSKGIVYLRAGRWYRAL